MMPLLGNNGVILMMEITQFKKFKNRWKEILFGLGLMLVVGGGGFLAGRHTNLIADDNPQALRIKRFDYDYISPLLACDFATQADETGWVDLETDLKGRVEGLVESGKFEQLSVYFRDFGTTTTISIRPEDKFFPASMNKVPVMMTVLKMAEEDPALLTREIDTSNLVDHNQGQEITPAAAVKPGERVTVMEAIEKMIKHSDNNGFYALVSMLDVNIYRQIHQDLKIPFERIDQSFDDFMTTDDYSYFLRVLYSATYLGKEYSELALELLSQSDFEKGLKAGINPAVPVAHKFGLLTRQEDPLERELHDCGVVYLPNNPYLLCIMTKSTLPLEDIEAEIAGISREVFDYATQLVKNKSS
jgi:beta-lactamase class A